MTLKKYRYKDIHTKSVKIKNYTYTVSRKCQYSEPENNRDLKIRILTKISNNPIYKYLQQSE